MVKFVTKVPPRCKFENYFFLLNLNYHLVINFGTNWPWNFRFIGWQGLLSFSPKPLRHCFLKRISNMNWIDYKFFIKTFQNSNSRFLKACHLYNVTS
jgi:hypothetical protein